MKIKEKKKFNWNLFFLVFLYIQPILDVSFALSTNYLQFPISLNTIVRMLFLLFGGIYLLFINKDKKIKWYVIILSLYCLAFGINIFIFKRGVLFYEIKNMLSTFFFPIALLFVYHAFKENKILIKEKHFLNLLLIYLGLILIPNILGIGFLSYAYSKSGFIGWFYSANAISSILIILLPISLINFNSKKDIWKFIIFFSIILYVFSSIGTKSPLLGLAVLLFGLIIWVIVKLFHQKKYKNLLILGLTLLIGLVMSFIIIPKTNFYKNIKLHMTYFDIYTINDIFSSNKFVYQIIFSERLDFLEVTKNNYKESSINDKIFGIGYVENYRKANENLKTIEIDYFDIYYRHGVIGFVLFFLPLIYIFRRLVTIFKKIDIKKYLYVISVFLSFLLAFFSGHVLISPAVGILVIYILVNLYERSTQYE